MQTYATTITSPPAIYADLGNIPKTQEAQDQAHAHLSAARSERKAAEARLVAVETDDRTPLDELGRIRLEAREAATAGAERVNRAEKACSQASHRARKAIDAALASEPGTKRRRALLDDRDTKVAEIRKAATAMLDMVLELAEADIVIEKSIDAERKSLGANIRSEHGIGSQTTQTRSAVIAAVDALVPYPAAIRHAIARALVGDPTDANLAHWTFTASELSTENVRAISGMVPSNVYRRWTAGDPKPAQHKTKRTEAADTNSKPRGA
jgi:hypothetical protein